MNVETSEKPASHRYDSQEQHRTIIEKIALLLCGYNPEHKKQDTTNLLLLIQDKLEDGLIPYKSSWDWEVAIKERRIKDGSCAANAVCSLIREMFPEHSLHGSRLENLASAAVSSGREEAGEATS